MGFAAGLAKASGGVLDAVVIAGGEDAAGAESVAAGLGGYGVATAHLVVGDGLGAYAPAAWAAGIGAVVAAGSYDAVVAPASDRATEVLAQVAARTGQPMAANVVSAEPGEPWRITRQRWAGSLLEDAVLDGAPRIHHGRTARCPRGRASGRWASHGRAGQRPRDRCRSARARRRPRRRGGRGRVVG